MKKILLIVAMIGLAGFASQANAGVRFNVGIGGYNNGYYGSPYYSGYGGPGVYYGPGYYPWYSGYYGGGYYHGGHHNYGHGHYSHH